MNLSNREELIAAMQQAAQPDPQAQQMAMAAQQAQLQFQQSQTNALNAQAQESQARAQKYMIDAQLAPQELEIDQISAITRNLQAGDQDDKEFERRMKVAQTLLKEKEIEAKVNVNDTTRNGQPNQPDQPSVQDALRQAGGNAGAPSGPRGPSVGPRPTGEI